MCHFRLLSTHACKSKEQSYMQSSVRGHQDLCASLERFWFGDDPTNAPVHEVYTAHTGTLSSKCWKPPPGLYPRMDPLFSSAASLLVIIVVWTWLQQTFLQMASQDAAMILNVFFRIAAANIRLLARQPIPSRIWPRRHSR